jgi:hypothetical protein
MPARLDYRDIRKLYPLWLGEPIHAHRPVAVTCMSHDAQGWRLRSAASRISGHRSRPLSKTNARAARVVAGAPLAVPVVVERAGVAAEAAQVLAET